MIDQNFVHLHVHTEFSLLDGLSRVKDVVARAKELGMPAVAITDHGTMFGAIDFYRAAKDAGIKPIIGLETYLAPRTRHDRDSVQDKKPFHLLLLAKNQQGYKNLLQLASRSQLEGYYYRPRVDWELLEQYSEGLVATSGCLAARIPQLVIKGQDDEARQYVGRFQEIFGAENFYLELQQHNIPEIETLNNWIVEYSKAGHTRVGLVATNDVHYVRESDFTAHDMLLCIQTGALVSTPKRKDHDNEEGAKTRMAMSDNSYFLNSAADMWRIFGEINNGEALKNSLKIAEMCEINLDDKEYHLPIFPVPPGCTAETYLRRLCEKGLDWRFGSRKNDPVVRQRLDRELDIIHGMGFDTYFLIVWDLCEYARNADIWWNVRGSGAGSLALYCLGITNIDPIQNQLLFERFLNPGRVSMPDIDIDYPDDRRGEMIAYAARKYGEDKVAAIITFGTMGAKAAIKDVARAMDVPLSEVNKAVSLIPTEAKQKRIEQYIEANPDLQKLYNENDTLRAVMDMAKQLQGINRHTSVHAAGVIVADKPLVEYLPLHRVTGKDQSGGALKQVTQFPMETAESIGLLKIDFLGLSTLTILRKACELVEKYHGIRYSMENIPYRHDDERLTDEDKHRLDEAFELMGRGETVGVFQLESSGMQQMLRGMRPKEFENIVAAVSLYRPGPMDFIPQYNRRLHGEEEPQFLHPRLEPILADTYAIIIYQEQLMQIASELFGYELGEADLMRRAVSKKKEKDLAKHRAIFLERGLGNGVDEDTANKIFDEIEFFANYGFNRSHAADYAVLTIQSAYLKMHYKEEFMTALLSVQRDDSTKVSTFLEECRRMHIPILPPDVNYSALDFDIQLQEDGRRGIRFGLAAVKNAGAGALLPIIEAREQGGAFKGVEDFCRRVDLRQVGKRTLESLIKVGALEKFGNRAQMLAVVDRVVSFSTRHHHDREIGRVSLFGDDFSTDELFGNLPNMKEYSTREMLGWEKDLLGLYVTGRPVDKFREQLRHLPTASIADLKRQLEEGVSLHERSATIAGEIVGLRVVFTKKGDKMGILTIEDWHDTAGALDVVLFPRTWDKVMAQVETGDLNNIEVGEVVKVSGKLDTGRESIQMIGESVSQNFDYLESAAQTFEDESVAEWMVGLEPESGNGHSTGNGHTTINGYGNGHSTPYAAPDWLPPAPDWTPTDEDEPLSPYDPFGDPFMETVEAEVKPRWVIVLLPRTGELERDQRRLKRLHSVLTSHPGKDRFAIFIDVDGELRRMDFPRHTTRCSDQLLQTLYEMVGAENVEVHEDGGLN